MTRIASYVYGIGMLIAGTGIGWVVHATTATQSPATVIRAPEGKYRFISPLIGFNPGEKNEFREYAKLERVLKTYVERLIRDKKIYSASVYFRDVESGHWTGVNEQELYSPASLYKVGLMMAVLKKSEDNPQLLEERVIFTGSKSPEAPDHAPLEKDRTYSIRELLERLIILSDNDAKDVLRDHIGNIAVSEVFNDLRIREPALTETGDTMSARTYSRFFRVLYNATYLSPASSEYALELLARVPFKSGIVNGLPEDARKLPVAHKYGYRVFEDPTDTVTEEMHDCGIVYIPERPYFLCIMTKGWKQTDLLDSIQLLSNVLHTEVTEKK